MKQFKCILSAPESFTDFSAYMFQDVHVNINFETDLF